MRSDIAFDAADGTRLLAWLFLPDGEGPHPAISMAHGYAAIKEQGLARFGDTSTDPDNKARRKLLHDTRVVLEKAEAFQGWRCCGSTRERGSHERQRTSSRYHVAGREARSSIRG